MELSKKYEREHSAISMRDLLLREKSYSTVSEELFSDVSNKFEGTFQNIPPSCHSIDRGRSTRSGSINTTTSSQAPLVEIKSSVKPKIKKVCKCVLIAANICLIIGLSVALIVVSTRNNNDEESGYDKQNKGSTTALPEYHRTSTSEKTSESTTQMPLPQETLSTVTTSTSSSTSTHTQETSAPAVSTAAQETLSTTLNGHSSSESTHQQDQTSTITIIESGSSTTLTSTSSSTTPSSTLGIWLQWGTWTDCSATCGNGIHLRYRECDKSDFQNTVCSGNYVEVKSCVNTICPEYGLWTLWSSWNDCDVTCSGGTQSRLRTCNKTVSALNCVGDSLQQRQCSVWNCPDCSIICNEGELTQTCDECLCNKTRQGYVKTTMNDTVSDAAIFINGSQSRAIAYSEDFGMFSTDVVCDDASIYVEKSGYSTSACQVSSEEIICNVNKNEKPIFNVQPQPKARLEGENVTLCCSASSSPDVNYYEWMKGSVLLDKSLYPYGETLHMTNVSESESGYYRCRANSDAGSMMSEEAQLHIKGTVNEFCDSTLGQRQIHLPDDCIQPISMTASYEVGYCNRQLCRRPDLIESDTCRDENQNCCTVADFDINTVFCGGYNLSVLSVKACGCGECSFDEVRIVGTVLYYGTDEFVRFGLVYLNGMFKTYTNTKGLFQVSVDERYGSAVITVISNKYQTTNVIDVSEGTTGTIYTNMYIARETCTFELNATEYNIIDIEKCEQGIDMTNSLLIMNVSAYSFIDSSLNIFDGIVKVYLTFLNATDVPELDIMPGMLYSVNQNGEKVHITSIGAFRLAFYDTALNVLKIGKQISFVSKETIEPPVNLFALQTSNGLWFPVSDELPAQLNELDFKSYINIGTYIHLKKECFFNIRIYEDYNHLSEITNSKYQLFIQALHIDGHQAFETYGHTFSTSRTCFKTICDETNGFIEVWISNFEKNTAEYLLPAYQSDNTKIGLSFAQQQLISYSASSSDPHLELKFKISSNGPFFETHHSCITNTQDGNHFKFHFQNTLEDVYTFRHFNDLSSYDANAVKVVSQRVWYPKRQEGHRVCFVKIKSILNTHKNIKVRVTSYGGTNKNISNEILGIRETHMSNSSSVCLEYKCSGTFNEEHSNNDFDNTKVEIQYISSIPTACAIESYSEELISKFSEINPEPQNEAIFVFYAPTASSPSLGIYSATTSSEDIESARSTAKKECQSGIPMDISSDNPDIGTAVTFSCTFN